MKERMAKIVNQLIHQRPMMFRNDCGMAYVGGKEARNATGKLVVIGPTRIKYGLHPGSADYIGLDNGRFCSVEIKLLGDKLSQVQRNWNKAIRKAGGIAEVWEEQQDGSIKIRYGEEIE